MEPMATDLLTVPEVAAMFRVQISTVRAWIRPSQGRRQRLPYVKLGRCVRIRRRDAEALIESSVVPVQTENGDQLAGTGGKDNGIAGTTS